MLPVGRRESQKRLRGAVVCAACGGPEEDAVHLMFTCGALDAARDQLHDALDSVTSGAFGQLQYDEPLDQVLLSLLDDSYWQGYDRGCCWLVCALFGCGVGGAGGCGGGRRA